MSEKTTGSLTFRYGLRAQGKL